MRGFKRCSPLAFVLLFSTGCSRGPALPDQPGDDPSARTTTAVNPPTSPQDLAAKCDVPLYPGAKAPEGMNRMPRRDPEGIHYDLVLTTPDPPRKVIQYYATSLKLNASTTGGALAVMGKTPKGNDAIIAVASEGGQTVVRIQALAYAK